MTMKMRSAAIVGLFIYALSTGVVSAQNLYNESIISIGSTSVLYVKDTIINEGTIINNGDMQVGGSWINHADYDAGQGQITFNSDARQIINHNDQSFSRLTLVGGGEKLFLADITIENELDLADGVLTTENGSRIIISESAVVTGGSDASHVNGPVYHRGSGDKLFPLGNGSVYLPVELLNVEGSQAEVGVTGIELNGQTLSASPSLQAISSNRYWQVDVVSGSVGNAQVILPVRDEDIVTVAEEVVVAQSNGADQPFESLGRSAFEGTTADGRVTSDRLLSMALLAVGTATGREGIIVYNALSPNGDDSNDFLIIGNIENFPDNKFTLFNRWGDKVFEIDNYDNKQRVFRGKTNIGGEKDLSSGTYFYTVETEKNQKKTHGFLVVKK